MRYDLTVLPKSAIDRSKASWQPSAKIDRAILRLSARPSAISEITRRPIAERQRGIGDATDRLGFDRIYDCDPKGHRCSSSADTNDCRAAVSTSRWVAPSLTEIVP